MAWNHMKHAMMFATLVCAGAAFAHSGATGIVKERMDAMKAIGDDMKIIGTMLRGQASFDAGEAQTAAQAIANHASQMTALFPEGSLSHPTEALPEIWDNWDQFVELNDALKSHAETLAQLAASGASETDIVAEFQKLGRTCSDCHEKFRVRK